MSQLLAYRVAVRAAQFAIAAAGILFLLLLFSRQAHAATGDENPGALQSVTSAASALAGPGTTGTTGTTVGSTASTPLADVATSVTSAAGSVINSAAKPVTAAIAAPAQAAAPPRSANSASRLAWPGRHDLPGQRQRSPARGRGGVCGHFDPGTAVDASNSAPDASRRQGRGACHEPGPVTSTRVADPVIGDEGLGPVGSGAGPSYRHGGSGGGRGRTDLGSGHRHGCPSRIDGTEDSGSRHRRRVGDACDGSCFGSGHEFGGPGGWLGGSGAGPSHRRGGSGRRCRPADLGSRHWARWRRWCRP